MVTSKRASAASRRKRTSPPRALRKLPTGVRGLDETLEGGIPAGRTLLVSGDAGTGKTVLACEFLYRGAERYGEPGVLVSFEESPADIFADVAGFGWDFPRLIRARRLAVVDVSPSPGGDGEVCGERYDLAPVLLRVQNAVRKLGARRLAIDGLDSLFARLANSQAVRALLFDICLLAKSLGVTTVITAERREDADAMQARHGEFVADGVLVLQVEQGQQRVVRHLTVKKLRGASYQSGTVEYQIDGNGVEVFAKLRVDRNSAGSRLEVRKPLGIPGFDELLGGGVPEGHMVLFSGNTGTGKTTFMQHFAMHGLRAGEAVVYVALEEPLGQVRQLAAAHGWNLRRYERQGRLVLLDMPPMDMRADDLLHRIGRTMQRIGARRLVIDSLSSLRSGTLGSEKMREFMIQLGEFVKAQKASCVMSFLIPGGFGADKGQLLATLTPTDARLSSAVDGVVLLRYVERGQRVKKLVNVLKMRGTRHDRCIHMYEIEDGGIRIGDKFEE
jgi:circadian clock protein KaiC